MHILVTNDDGPPSNQSSPYIHSFVRTLQSAGHTVSVVLPHQQRSWIGKAHFASQIVKPTYFRPGTLHEDDGTTHAKPLDSNSKENVEEWVLVNSTPATAAQLGLYHFFQDRGPVDLVVSGPNYGRNTTSLFSLSSGTIGGALEAAVCRKRAIALSYAFFSRDHDPKIIAGASRMSVRLIEHLMKNWDDGADLYSVNVPLVEGVEGKKVMYTYALQNYWKSGSSFTEVDAEEDEDPEEKEAEIRKQEEKSDCEVPGETTTRHKHRHFKWTPNFTDVYHSVEESEPGNDGRAVKEGLVSVTPLKSNFMHVPGLQGELKLSPMTHHKKARVHALVTYEDDYTQPIILSALSSIYPPETLTIADSVDRIPKSTSPCLQIRQYESIPFQQLADHPETIVANSYPTRMLIRKHFLAHTIQSYLVKYPGSELKNHAPTTVHIEVDYADFLDEALIEAYELHDLFARNEGKDANDREWWILKPSMGDRGQGIRLFSTEDELYSIFQQWEQDQPDSDQEDSEASSGEELTTSRQPSATTTGLNHLSPEKETHGEGIMVSQLRHFVAQPYIPPLLLPAYNNRKFHIRTYVLCFRAMHVYVYREMLALFAQVPYRAPGSQRPNSFQSADTDLPVLDGPTDMRPHLTNTCLQNPDSTSSPPTVFPLSILRVPPESLIPIRSQIYGTTSHLFRAAIAQPTHFQPLPNAFEIFGLDWLVDPEKQVHLLEVNAFPDFRQSGEEGREVVEGLWKGVLGVVLRGVDGDGGFFGNMGDQEGHHGNDWGMEKILDVDMGLR